MACDLTDCGSPEAGHTISIQENIMARLVQPLGQPQSASVQHVPPKWVSLWQQGMIEIIGVVVLQTNLLHYPA